MGVDPTKVHRTFLRQDLRIIMYSAVDYAISNKSVRITNVWHGGWWGI